MGDWDLTLRLAVIAMLAATLVLMLAGAAGLLAVGAWVAADAVRHRRQY